MTPTERAHLDALDLMSAAEIREVIETVEKWLRLTTAEIDTLSVGDIDSFFEKRVTLAIVGDNHQDIAKMIDHTPEGSDIRRRYQAIAAAVYMRFSGRTMPAESQDFIEAYNASATRHSEDSSPDSVPITRAQDLALIQSVKNAWVLHEAEGPDADED